MGETGGSGEDDRVDVFDGEITAIQYQGLPASSGSRSLPAAKVLPDMHQTRKGNQGYFGMKGHFGVDSRTWLIHRVVATPANVHDSAYQGQGEVIRACAPGARDFTHRRYRRKGVVDELERAKNRTRSSVRARVEHSIGVIKRIFGFVKVRYRGLAKNANRQFATCALANLYRVRRRLLRPAGA